MKKPGRKSKSTCPAQIHYRPSKETMAFLDSLGPAGTIEKIDQVMRDAAKNRCPSTVPDLQNRIIDLGLEIKRLAKNQDDCFRKMKSLGLSEIEFEEISANIHKIIYPEKYL